MSGMHRIIVRLTNGNQYEVLPDSNFDSAREFGVYWEGQQATIEMLVLIVDTSNMGAPLPRDGILRVSPGAISEAFDADVER